MGRRVSGTAEARRRRRWRRHLRRGAYTVVGAAAAFAVAGLPVYVFPPSDEVTQADLIYVIGPPTNERVAIERALRLEGVADQSLYSVSLQGGWSEERMAVCREEDVFCEHPTPFTTQGEADHLNGFAAEHGVDKTIVLTFTPHVARTRYIFGKCYDGDVDVVAVDEHLGVAEWIYEYAYQTAGFVKAWFTPCPSGAD